MIFPFLFHMKHKREEVGLAYDGGTHALGACRLGSIPSSPNGVRDEQSNSLLCVWKSKGLVMLRSNKQTPARRGFPAARTE